MPTQTITPDDPLQLVGHVLDGTYRVDAVVGEGGFGIVYRALHLQFDALVAVKCLKIPWTAKPEVREAFLAKFSEEAKLLLQLSKGTLGIVHSIASGALDTPAGIWAPYFVLEWLDGESMESVLGKRRAQGLRGCPLAEAIEWLDMPARALAYAHTKRVAHRDIKPANLFVLRDEDGGSNPVPTIKVLDFGIAKAMEQDQRAAVKGFTTLGYSTFSPKYAASEQVDVRLGSTGPWSDVYSFALVMVEVLTDRQAVDSEDAVSLMLEVLNPLVRPTPRSRGAFVAQAVEDVFAKALQVNPSDRFQSMGEFWRALAVATQGDSVSISAPSTGSGGCRGGTDVRYRKRCG